MSDQNQAINLLSVESLINTSTVRVEEIQKELREFKEMINSVLENDDEYQEALKEAKKTAKNKSVAKERLIRLPENVQLVEKIKEHQHQMKELRIALSDYLAQYVSLSGTNQIEGPDGVLRQIIYTAKLVKTK
jgi:DNA repair exonuclease SbcCD ATPase subunit